MDTLIVVLCTFPDAATARQLGTELVGKQLAACVNLLPGVESIFRWQGETENATEVLALIKTTRAAYPDLARALASGHPYEVPEIVALAPETVADGYLAWVMGEVRAAQPG